MKQLADFVLYNNTFTLIIVVVFISGGTVMAANETAREGVAKALVASTDAVVSVDNTYITSVDLADFDTRMQITGVTEDENTYYVAHTFTSIEIVDGTWQEVSKEDVLIVNKEQLADRDLGLYAAEQLAQVSKSLVTYLMEVQTVETALGVNTKKIERTYTGLVGRFLDPDEIEFEGYDPVIEEPEPVVVVVNDSADTPPDKGGSESQTEAGEAVTNSDDDETDEPVATTTDPGSDPDISTSTPPTSTTTQPISTTTLPVVDDIPPALTLAGDSSIELLVGDSYTELGATATDETDGDLSAAVIVSGTVDTTVAAVYTISYQVIDQAGNETLVERTVTVVPEPEPDPEPEEEVELEEETASSTDET